MKRLSFSHILTRISLVVLAVVMLYPFWYMVCMAFSTFTETLDKSLLLWPAGFTLDAFKYVLNASDFAKIFSNTMIVVVVGTSLSLVVTIAFAYPLSRKVPGYKWLQYFAYFTIIFSGGTIPTFMIVKMTGLLNSLWSLIIPGLMNPFNMFLMRNFFNTVPDSLDEAAQIEGASPLWILFRIMIPLSMAGIATIALYYGVGYWNAYFNALLYITKRDMWTLQVLLREMLISVQPDLLGGAGSADTTQSSSAQLSMTVKMATVLISSVPIMIVYPFLQKYFVKGVMVGAVKG